jgi:hypothetical protein
MAKTLATLALIMVWTTRAWVVSLGSLHHLWTSTVNRGKFTDGSLRYMFYVARP